MIVNSLSLGCRQNIEHGTAVPAGRVFSIAGNIVTAKRLVFSPDKVGIQVFLMWFFFCCIFPTISYFSMFYFIFYNSYQQSISGPFLLLGLSCFTVMMFTSLESFLECFLFVLFSNDKIRSIFLCCLFCFYFIFRMLVPQIHSVRPGIVFSIRETFRHQSQGTSSVSGFPNLINSTVI